MNIREFYPLVGGDFEDVLGRLQSEVLILRFVKKFPDDPSYRELIEAEEKRDIETAFRAAHTLKGVAASLGFRSLFSAASELTERLRPKKDFPEEELFAAVGKEYRKVIDAVAALEASA